jgi:hypothetical protein
VSDYTRRALRVGGLVLGAVACWVVLIAGFYLLVDVLFGWPA